MISEEVFTQALLLTHTYDPNVPPSQRLQAERYLVELRSHHEGLQLAFYLIGDRPLPAEQQQQQQQQQQMAIRELQYFWAFNTILEQLPGCSEALRNDGAQAEQLLGRLLDFLQRSFAECAVRPIAEYVMNKHAQLMVAGLQLLYPAQWGSFFDQLFALRAHYCTYAAQADPRHAVHSPSQENHNSNNNNNNISTSGSASACSSPQPAESYGNNNNNNNNITSNNGEEMAMMNGQQQQQSGRSSGRSVREMATMYVLRVFEYIDERVVGDRAQPGPEREQRTRNMAVKDALRERVMPMAVEVWCEILSVQHAELMQQANTTSSSSSNSNNSSVSMARLCLSVMQSYVAWIDIKLLLTPAWMNLLYSLLALPPLRAEATEVLLALVTKKQLPGTKLDTLARLRISEVVEALVNSLVVRMKQTGHGTGGSEAHTMYSNTTGPGAAGYLVAENSNTNNANRSALFGSPTRSVSSHDARGGAEVWGEEDEAFESVVSRLTMAVAEQFLQLLELLTNNTDSSSMSAGMSSEENNMQAGGYRHGGLAVAPRGSGASGEDEEANHGLRAAHGYSDGSHDSLSHLASPRSARSLAGSASPYNTSSSNNNNNNNNAAAAAAVAAAAAAANGVQDIAFDLTPQLLQNLSDVLHGCVAHLLRLLKLVNLYDLRDEFLPFIQSYVKSPALLPEEAAELLYTLFDQTRLSRINTAEEDGGEQGEEDGEGHEGRVQNAYIASQGYSPNSYALDKNNTMGSVANKYHTAVRDTSSDVLVERYEDRIWDEAVTTQRKALHNLIRLLYRRQPQLVLEHLQAYVERITSTTTSNNNNSTAEEDADEVEAVLRYFYEMGEAVKLDCLREMDHPFTQLLTRIVTADIIAQHASSLVHLAFFEVLDRYYVFFTMHREYIAVLLHRLLLLPCGVVNRRARVRARICYLFSHLLSVLKACLVPYAKDMVLALQSILTSVPSLVLPNDARQLYEATGVLLRVLFTNASSAMQANTNGSSNNNNNNTTVDGACTMHSSNNNNSGGTSHMSGSPSSAMTGDNNNNAHNGQKSLEATYASNHNAGSAAAAAGEDEMRASCALLESVSEQAVGALHTVSHRITTVSTRDAMITTSQSLSPLSSPHSTRTYETKESAEAHSIDAIADAISYLTALAKGLGGLSMNESNSNSNNNNNNSASNNTQGCGASRSLGSSPPTNATTTTSSTSNACLATTTTNSSNSVCGEVVMRVYLSMTQEVMLSSQHWHAASVVREATGQFFHQMVNTVPYDGLVPYLAQYIADCLAAMEFVPELTKLLRLLYQCISRTGAAAAALIVDVLPALWSKLSEVGALSEAAPVISMGVMSESAREKVEVYRQFFALLHGAAAKGCARALLVNVPLLRAVLDELMHALELPAELELPRLAVQTFTRLAIECTTMMMAAAAAAAAANGGGENEETCATQRQGNTNNNNTGSNNENPRRGGADTRDSPGASSALVSSSTSAAAAAAAAASTAEQQAMFLEYCVQSVLPQALAVFFRPQFDLKDAKHFMLIGEIGLLCKAVVQAYGEAALQVMYTCLVKPLGETGAMTFCVTVRDAPQMSAAVKAKLRQLLAQRMT